MTQTTHISTSGGLISAAFVENIRQAQTNQRGTQPDTFGLPWQEAPKSPAALEARIAETWEALLERWDTIAADMPAMDISQARDRWILPLLRALDFQPVYQRSDIVLDDSEALRFNISHFGWPEEQSAVSNQQSAISTSAEAGDSKLTANGYKLTANCYPPPIHTILPAASLDARPAVAAAGRSPKGKSPHDMLQLFLNVNRTYRWAILTNGLYLRLLRDYHHTYSKGYVEFDLESIFEARNFADFRALYRLAHASRFTPPAETLRQVSPVGENEAPAPELWDSVPLEMFYRDSQAAGIQVGADLQKQVREAIETLGNGFLASSYHRSAVSDQPEADSRKLNAESYSLLQRLQQDAALCQTFYAELLHIVYRILFLLYAEQRGMVPHPGAPLEILYRQGYSLTALRARAENDPASPEAYDLWEGLKVTFKMFQKGAADLGVYRYNGMLFAEDQTPLLDSGQPEAGSRKLNTDRSLRCRNYELLHAIRVLTLVEREGVLQRISYADLDVEEIGGIYESLLDFAPRVTTTTEEVDGRQIPPNTFFLDPRGTARKTTGSYYTHPSLVNALIESALVPVLNHRMEEAVSGQPSAVSRQPEADSRKLNADSPALSALTPEQRAAAEQAILSLKVCDPAAGSGHFLIAANNALALRLAQVRTGEDYPAERELRQARRDVLAHCIYGVDLNPMAVELCKVALWINAAVDDAPLSFLDHHLKNGNSLIGATPELLKDGIPDDAFQPVTGDDPKVASAVRKRNKKEREGQLSLWRVTVLETLADLARWRELNELAEDEPQIAERRYAEYRADPAYRNARLVADLWTAAFFWSLDEDNDLIPTEELFRQAQADPDTLPAKLIERVAELADHHKFFHWYLEFPDVFDENNEGGFHVVLGNPPWEKVEVEEIPFFAAHYPDIASAQTASQRKHMINQLISYNPELYQLWLWYKIGREKEREFIRNSGKFPLTGVGKFNTYALFAELAQQIVSQNGQAGLVVQGGIATDNTTKMYFGNLINTRTLVSWYEFENNQGIFPEVHRQLRFGLITVSGQGNPRQHTWTASELTNLDQLNESDRKVKLQFSDFSLFNPNTLTSPKFKTVQDYKIAHWVYSNCPPLIRESPSLQNLWKVELSRMVNMADDSQYFRTATQLEARGYTKENANHYQKGHDSLYLPLYESKMLYQFDHRFGTFEGVNEDGVKAGYCRELKEIEQKNPHTYAVPRYWIQNNVVREKVDASAGDRGWLLAYRDITNITNERTVICAVIPKAPVGHTAFLIRSSQAASTISCLLANLNCFSFDYLTRQKLSGLHLSQFILKQLPVLPPDRYSPELLAFIIPRAFELTYTAWDLRTFADDIWAEAVNAGQKNASHPSPLQRVVLQQWAANRDATGGGHQGAEPPEWAETTAATPFPHPPFKWDEERRAQLRADLDGLYGHLYGLSREELAYILDTFPIVRRKDEAQYGEYRTKRMVLEAYDRIKGSGLV